MLTSAFHHKTTFGYKTASSFAYLADRYAASGTTPTLKTRFAPPARRTIPITADQRRRNGASEDGLLGGVILDAFFAAAFPGLGFLLHGLGGFGATDIVDIYDRARDAFNPHAGRKTPLTRRPVMARFMPMPRPKKSFLDLIFG